MKVFLSYVNSDREKAHRLAQQLERHGLSIWLADQELMPGENWALRIGEALDKADALVVLITPESMRSDEVRREIDYALASDRFAGRVFPVVAGKTDDIPWILRHLKLLDLKRRGMTGTAQAIAETLTLSCPSRGK